MSYLQRRDKNPQRGQVTQDGRIDRMRGNYVAPTRYDPTFQYRGQYKHYGKEVKVMSGVLWCDSGQHAFSTKDPNRRHYVEETTGKDKYGDALVTREEFDICGPHANGLFQSPETPKEVSSDK